MDIVQPTRRGFINGIVSLIAAPAVIRTIDLMPAKIIAPTVEEVVAVRSGVDLGAMRDLLMPGLKRLVDSQYKEMSGYDVIFAKASGII